MWKDVSEETGWEHHWHHRNPPEDSYLSIRMADESSGVGLGPYHRGWTVELYPDPDNDGHMTRWHFDPEGDDSPRAHAIEKVEQIMERHA